VDVLHAKNAGKILIKAFALAAAKNLQSALVPKKANNFFAN